MTSEIIDLQTLYRGWLKLMQAELRLEGGQVIRREIEHHGAAACVLPYDEHRGTALLVRQLRAPVLYLAGEPDLVEAIAGVVDDEDPAECARREAMEEAGVVLDRLERVTTAWAMPGISTEQMHFYFARYDAGTPLRAPTGEDEAITVVEMALKTLAHSVDTGEIRDLKTLFLVQTLRLRQPALFA